MSNFDIERARRGEPIECRLSPGSHWHDCLFVGARRDGTLVVEECINGGEYTLAYLSAGYLRMKPKPPIQMWVQLYHAGNESIPQGCTHAYPTKQGAIEWCRRNNFKTIGEPQPVLVPDES